MLGIVILGYGPLFYGVVYYFKDVWTYLTKNEKENIQMWQVRGSKRLIHKRKQKKNKINQKGIIIEIIKMY